MICGEGEGGGVYWIKRKGGLEAWVEEKSKMARERASSALTPLTETTLFVGPKIPDEIKRMIPHLTKIDKALFRKILQGRLAEDPPKLSL